MRARPFPPGDRRSLVLTADLPDEDHARWIEAAALFSPEIAVARVRGESRFQAVQRLRPDLVVVHGRCFDDDPTPGLLMTSNRYPFGQDLSGGRVNDVAPALMRALRRLGREHKQVGDLPPDTRGHILVVDDELSQLRSYTRVLRRYRGSLRLSYAVNGVEGLESIRRDPPDVVATNMAMPVMDGYDMIKALRSAPSTSTMFIVVVSGGGGLRGIERVYELRPDSVLLKPVAISTLRHTIALGLRHSRGLQLDGIPLPPYVA
ncbi:MAG: response regulator [Deltaproteobacteria bacterium]